MEETIKLLKEAGLEIRDSQLFIQALTHRSYIHENSGSNSNERLEFLGDGVLNCSIARCLYDQFDGLKEGELSRLLTEAEGMRRALEEKAARGAVLQRTVEG